MCIEEKERQQERETKRDRAREREQEREKSRVRVKKRFAYLHSSICVSNVCTYGGKERMGQMRRREVVCAGVAIMMLLL